MSLLLRGNHNQNKEGGLSAEGKKKNSNGKHKGKKSNEKKKEGCTHTEREREMERQREREGNEGNYNHDKEKRSINEQHHNKKQWEMSYNKTRLIVKNIPKYMNEIDLKKHFFQMNKKKNFKITDIKIMRKKKVIDQVEQYISRNICFIGFLNETDCENFKNFFNNTYINQSKIIIENALNPNCSTHNYNNNNNSNNTYYYHDHNEKHIINNNHTKYINNNQGQHTIIQKTDNVLNETVPVKTTKAGMSNIRIHTIFLDDEENATIEKTKKKETKEDEEQPEETNINKDKQVMLPKKGNDIDLQKREQIEEGEEEEEENALSWLKKISQKKSNEDKHEMEQETKFPEQHRDYLNNSVQELFNNSKNGEQIEKEKNAEENEEENEEEHMNTGKIFIFNLPPVNETDVKMLCEQYGPVVDVKIFKKGNKHNSADINLGQDKNNKSNELFFINLLKESDSKLKGKKENKEKKNQTKNIIENEEKTTNSDATAIDTDLTYIKVYAFVSFMFPSSCEKAKHNLNNTIYKGKIINVKYAKEKGKYIQNTENQNKKAITKLSYHAKSSYQKIKEIQKKRTCQNENIWNILYTDINTSIYNFCKETNCSRESVLNIRDKNIATNVALTETYIISKMKEWMKKEGICVEAFQQVYVKKDIENENERTHNGEKQEDLQNEHYETVIKYKRSEDTIIVKNLSMATNKNDIINLFKKYGTLKKNNFSPYNIMAIIQFEKAENAKRAFLANSYLRYKSLPLYLEWAPVNFYESVEKKQGSEDESKQESKQEEMENEHKKSLEEKNKSDKEQKVSVAEKEIEKKKQEENTSTKKTAETLMQSEDESSDDETPHASIFIKNINFSTTEESLGKLFEPMEGFLTCNIVKSKKAIEQNEQGKKKDEKPKYISLGYGFAEFKTKENAKEAMKKLTAVTLDDRVLDMTLSHNRIKKKKETNETKVREKILDNKNISKKIVVKNLAFQANKHELRNLFTPFGNVKSVRIPKNAYNRSRGYAFVEFMSKKECVRAIEALAHVHFYGRPLVLEFANDYIFEQNLDDYEKLQEKNNNTDGDGKKAMSAEQAKRKAIYEAEKAIQQTESKRRKMAAAVADI